MLLLLLACARDDSAKESPVCYDGTSWSTGQLAFRDATAEWGLDTLGATGTRIESVDYDRDGWPDLEVRSATDGADDFAAGTRYQEAGMRMVDG